MYGSGIYGLGIYGGLTALATSIQDTYPERVQVVATNLVEGQVVSITRRPAGSTIRTAVRGADALSVDFDALVRVDAEAPMGVLLTYTLTIDGVDLDTETETLTLEGGNVAVTDAITGDAAEVVITAWPEKRRERSASVFRIGARTVVVSGSRGGFSGAIEVFTETDIARDALLELLETATAGIVQIRQAGPYAGVDCYVAILADTETRWSQDGSDERRIIALDVVETAAWAPGLETSAYTLQDVADLYVGLTLQDLADDYATLLDLAVGDFSA